MAAAAVKSSYTLYGEQDLFGVSSGAVSGHAHVTTSVRRLKYSHRQAINQKRCIKSIAAQNCNKSIIKFLVKLY